MLLELSDLFPQRLNFLDLVVFLSGGAEVGIRRPPVNAHLAGLVHGADYQANLDGQKLDIHELDLDVAGDHQALVQDAFQNIRQGRGVR